MVGREAERAIEHEHWDFQPEFVHHPGEHGLPESLAHPETIRIESICGGINDSQPVEQYNGALGVSRDFVDAHQSPVGQLQWNDNLGAIYTEPGNVSGARWGTGTLISRDLFLTAGHCFDQTGGGWQRPIVNGTTNIISPPEIATNMRVNFNYQVDSGGVLRQEQQFAVLQLVEYRVGNLDYAIVRLDGNPGEAFGWTPLSPVDATEDDTICLIQHPAGLPKRIEAGRAFHLHDDLIGYDDIDTLGGSSGSGILLSPDGTIVGVHTHGGCDAVAIGHNHGVRISSIWNASLAVSTLPLSFAPTLSAPPNGATLTSLGTSLTWQLPAGSTQYHIQITPYNNDGPRINLIRNAESSFAIQPPVFGLGNYVMLPGMTYTWRVRATTKTSVAPESDPSWGPWSEQRNFRTPAPSSSTVSVVSPTDSSNLASTSPIALQWANTATDIFYYEVQVSADPNFGEQGAVAAVWHNLVHGGITTPLNSWTTPDLQPGVLYFWRVRPRVQGDGMPVAWSAIWSFRTQ